MIISYCTLETPYEDEAVQLSATIGVLGLKHHIKRVSLPGLRDDWLKACAHKAVVIANALAEYCEPIIWLDADARVLKYPHLLTTGLASRRIDFAAHWLRGKDLLSGTLYFGHTEAAAKLVAAWIEMNTAMPDVMDQKNLQALINTRPEPWPKSYRLPPAYCWIDADDPKRTPDVSEQAYGPMDRRDVVIQQTQASRRLRQAAGAG